MPKETITIQVECKNSLDKRNIEASMKKLAKMSFEDRQRITEIIDNPKAVKGLEEHWTFLKGMFK